MPFDKTLLPQEVFQKKFFEIKRKKQGNDSVCMKEALSWQNTKIKAMATINGKSECRKLKQ